jgi:hypothetical protein
MAEIDPANHVATTQIDPSPGLKCITLIIGTRRVYDCFMEKSCLSCGKHGVDRKHPGRGGWALEDADVSAASRTHTLSTKPDAGLRLLK